jgi:hypothetical protein
MIQYTIQLNIYILNNLSGISKKKLKKNWLHNSWLSYNYLVLLYLCYCILQIMQSQD